MLESFRRDVGCRYWWAERDWHMQEVLRESVFSEEVLSPAGVAEMIRGVCNSDRLTSMLGSGS